MDGGEELRGFGARAEVETNGLDARVNEWRARFHAGDVREREATIRRAGRVRAAEAFEPLLEVLQHGEADERGAAAWSIGQLRRVEAIGGLVRALGDPEFLVRSCAGWALVALGTPAIRPLLDVVRSTDNEDAATMARLVLERMPAEELLSSDLVDTGELIWSREETRGARLDELWLLDRDPSVSLRALRHLHDTKNRLQELYAIALVISDAPATEAPHAIAPLTVGYEAAKALGAATHRLLGVFQVRAASERRGDDRAMPFPAREVRAYVLEATGTLGRVEWALRRALEEIVSPCARHEVSGLLSVLQALRRHVSAIGELAAGGQSQPSGRLSIEAAAELAEKLFLRITPTRDLAITVEVEPTAAALEASAEVLETCLHNLLTNAVKYTESGEIVVTFAVVDGILELTVRDTGRGIATQDLPAVFEARGAQGPSGDAGASSALPCGADSHGVGLATLDFAVRDAGGRVAVESKRGIGSTFRVWLPLRDARAPAVAGSK